MFAIKTMHWTSRVKLALVKKLIFLPFFLTSRLVLVVVVVVVLRVVLVRDIELMVSWGESQSWKTCVVAMTIACGPLNVSQLELHWLWDRRKRKIATPFTESRYALFRCDAPRSTISRGLTLSLSLSLSLFSWLVPTAWSRNTSEISETSPTPVPTSLSLSLSLSSFYF